VSLGNVRLEEGSRSLEIKIDGIDPKAQRRHAVGIDRIGHRLPFDPRDGEE